MGEVGLLSAVERVWEGVLLSRMGRTVFYDGVWILGGHGVSGGGVGVGLLWVELVVWVPMVTLLGESSLNSICVGNVVLTSRTSVYWDDWLGER